MKYIQLTQGKEAIVDDDLFEYLSQFKWHAHFCGSNFYAAKKYQAAYGKGRIMFLHHMVVGFPISRNVVDHINRNSLDNRRENLRIVSYSENARNSISRERNAHILRFGGRGYYWHKSNKRWCSAIKIKGKTHWLGSFKNESEAKNCYLQKLESLKFSALPCGDSAELLLKQGGAIV